MNVPQGGVPEMKNEERLHRPCLFVCSGSRSRWSVMGAGRVSSRAVKEGREGPSVVQYLMNQEVSLLDPLPFSNGLLHLTDVRLLVTDHIHAHWMHPANQHVRGYG